MDVALLRKKEVQAWVPVDDEVKVLCRFVDQTVWEKLREQAVEKVIIDKETVATEDRFDNDLFRRLLGRYAVLDTSGLTDGIDAAGEPVPLITNDENIDMLMDGWTEFRLTVMASPLQLKKMIQLQADDLKKNS